MIDAAAYRRLTSLARMLVDQGHLTPYGLRMLDALVIEESAYREEERTRESLLDLAESTLLASGYTPNEDLVDASEWSARQVAEIVLTALGIDKEEER